MKASASKCPRCGKLTILAKVHTFIIRRYCAGGCKA